MSEMFSGCRQLTNLNLSSFITSEFKNMDESFGNIHDLHDYTDHEIFDIIEENIKKKTLFKTFLYRMFDCCHNLKNIITYDINIINQFKQK